MADSASSWGDEPVRLAAAVQGDQPDVAAVLGQELPDPAPAEDTIADAWDRYRHGRP